MLLGHWRRLHRHRCVNRFLATEPTAWALNEPLVGDYAALQAAGEHARSYQPATLPFGKARLGVVGDRVPDQFARRSRPDRSPFPLRLPGAGPQNRSPFFSASYKTYSFKMKMHHNPPHREAYAFVPTRTMSDFSAGFSSVSAITCWTLCVSSARLRALRKCPGCSGVAAGKT